ncbi:MAG: PAS-domain containing protein [Hyphomicrobiales bacterium]
MQLHLDRWLSRGVKYLHKSALSRSKKYFAALPVLLSSTLLTSTSLHAASLVENYTTSNIISYAAFVATLVFAIVGCGVFMRSSSRAEQERDVLSNELADLRAYSDRFETLIQADDQRFMIWQSTSQTPTIIGDLPDNCSAPTSFTDFTAFGKWLQAPSAAGLERHIAALRSDGTAFQLAIATHEGNYLDAYGRSMGGQIFVRFRDLSGDQQVILELRRQLSEKSSEAKTFQALLEELPQPSWLGHQNEAGERIIKWANKAYHDAVDSAANTKVLAELLDKEARDAMTQLHEQGSPFKQRVNAISNGNRCTFDVVSVPTESGSAGIATDVSDAEKAQTALNRTIKAHETTFNELATAVVIFDKSHKLTFHNKAYRELFGLEEVFLTSAPNDSEILDKLRSIEKLPVEANYRQWKKNILDVHQSVETQEFTWYLPDGQTLRVVASPRASGGVTWIYENMTAELDIKKRVNVLSCLQRETLNRLSDGVAVFSSDGKLTLKNASFMKLWGLDDEILVTNPDLNSIAEICVEKYACKDDWHALKMAVVGVSDKPDEADGTMERPDGSVIRYSTNALIDGSRMITFVDITDSVNFENAMMEKNEALSEADKLKTDFVQHVSYELRSPLTNIIGFTQLLSDADIGPLTDKQQEYTDYILSSSSSVLAIINDILDLATADAGVLELSLSEVSVRGIINNAVEGLKDRLRERQIKLTQTIAPDVDTFIGDERRMIQTLFNLLSNAIQFSEENSEISLIVSSKDEYLIFEVQDWGAGISETFINQVFERFESQEQGSVRGGAGLGLSIVKRFVELHHGHVAIDSQEGEGTKITCVIPMEPDHNSTAAE